MMPRTRIRSSVLEWGQLSCEPGSRVTDDAGAPIFTESRVCSVTDQLLTGAVVELVSVEKIRVLWSTQATSQLVSAREVHVLVALPRL